MDYRGMTAQPENENRKHFSVDIQGEGLPSIRELRGVMGMDQPGW